MRRPLALLLLAISLTACSGKSSSNSQVACVEKYWDGQVGTCLPSGWQVVTRERMQERGLPPEVVTGFERTEAVSGQTPVVIVTREVLPSATLAKTYSDASLRSVTTLPGFTEVDTRNLAVDDSDVQLHIYTAQPQPQEPARRFYQVSTVAGGAGYTFTGLAPFSVDKSVENEIVTILSNATFVAPAK